MNILGIDTTKKQALIFGVLNDNKVVHELQSYEKHSEHLLEHIEEVLSNNGLKVKDIDVFANISGPGSFTGIRIGLTTIKALNFPFNKKIINISVFDALKNVIKNGLLLLECTSTSVYFCEFLSGKVKKYGVWNLTDIPENVEEQEIFVLKQEQIQLSNSYKVNVIENYSEHVLQAIVNEVGSGNFCDNCVPFYIALSQAEKKLVS